MKIGLRLLYLSCLCLLLWSPTTFSQDFDKLDDFFDRDYAKDPLNQRTKSPAIKSPKTLDNNTKQQQEQAEPEYRAPEFDLSMPTTTEQELSLEVKEVPLGTGKGIPVIAVSMISDSSDLAHTFENLKIYTDFLEGLDLAAGAFFLTSLTDFPPDAPMEWIKVLARGGIITVEPSIAEEYQVSKSPSWIIRLEEGDIVLEGLYSIHQFFNARGEFLNNELQKIRSKS